MSIENMQNVIIIEKVPIILIPDKSINAGRRSYLITKDIESPNVYISIQSLVIIACRLIDLGDFRLIFLLIKFNISYY